jgi:hypothetical protein
MQSKWKRFPEIRLHNLRELVDALLHSLPAILKMYCLAHARVIHINNMRGKDRAHTFLLSTLLKQQQTEVML